MNQPAAITPPAFWLEGNYAPVFNETTAEDLHVEGQIPADLNGRYLRIGPDPKNGTSDHWFLGDGMVHGIELRDGKVNWYRNRYVQTPMYTDPKQLSVLDSLAGLEMSLANTHIISHAGKILALEELHYPFEMSPDLETIGPHTFDGKLNTGMTAHPKICAKTGELLFFAYGLTPPYMTYHRVSREGELVQTEVIEVKGATMVHDFNITENFVIFMDLPLTYDLDAIASGGLPLKWDESYGARLGVMPRTGSNADIIWYDIEPCYVFHPVNAYEDGNRIVIDVCRSAYSAKENAPDAPPYLHRWKIDQETGTVNETPLGDVSVEFPRVPDSLVGQPHRYGYMAEMDTKGVGIGVAIQKYDFQTRTHVSYPLPTTQRCGEPVFVEKENSSSEDDGYLLSFLYDEASNTSEFIILSASDIEAGPIARIKLPVRIPFGFHGSWVADQ